MLKEDAGFEDWPLTEDHEADRSLAPELWSSVLWEEEAKRACPVSTRELSTKREGWTMSRELEPFWVYDDVDDNDFEDDLAHEDLDYEEDEFGFEEYGCVFGDGCCMPGFHFRSECYTPEMAEEWYAAEAAADVEEEEHSGQEEGA